METDTLIRKLLKSAPSEWQGITDAALKKLPPSEVGSIARAMEDDAARLAFLAEYLAHRSGSGTCGDKREHKDAVKAAQSQCRRVNKAMGYTFADRRTFRI